MMWRSRRARLRDEALLVAFAERLCEASASAAPRAQFRDSLRTTLVMEGSTALIAPPMLASRAATWTRPGMPRRRVAIVTALAASILGVSGMASASASALPGDALYPVKRGVENVELALQRGDADRGVFQLQLAAERLAETAHLVRRGTVDSSLEAETLTEYNDQAEDGSTALLRSYQATRDSTNISTINRFASKAYEHLASLEGQLEGAAAVALASAQEQLSSIVRTSFRLCPDCGGIDADLVSALEASRDGTPDESVRDPAQPSEPDASEQVAPGVVSPRAGTSSDDDSAPTGETRSDDDSEKAEEEPVDAEPQRSDEVASPLDRVQLSPLPNILTPMPLPGPTLTLAPTPLPSPTPTPTVPPTPVPTPTPSCHLDQGNGKSCHLVPPGLGLR